MTNKWLSPTEFKSDTEFLRTYNISYAKAMAFRDLIELIDGAAERIKAIEKRVDDVQKGMKYAI